MLLDHEELKGFHVVSTPQKYRTTKDDIRQAFKCLSVREFLIYTAFQIYTCREIAGHFKKSIKSIKRVYIRACEKVAEAKGAQRYTKPHRGERGSYAGIRSSIEKDSKLQ